MDWRSPFDEEMATNGPPAVFTVDAKGRLGVDEARTRETWCRVGGMPERGECHCLFMDTATGWVQYVLVTSEDLCRDHPRASIEHFESEQQALDALAALGPLPSRSS
jgi:hypothetical protein